MESHKEMATKKDEERDRVSLVPLQAGLRAAFGESLAWVLILAVVPDFTTPDGTLHTAIWT